MLRINFLSIVIIFLTSSTFYSMNGKEVAAIEIEAPRAELLSIKKRGVNISLIAYQDHYPSLFSYIEHTIQNAYNRFNDLLNDIVMDISFDHIPVRMNGGVCFLSVDFLLRLLNEYPQCWLKMLEINVIYGKTNSDSSISEFYIPSLLVFALGLPFYPILVLGLWFFIFPISELYEEFYPYESSYKRDEMLLTNIKDDPELLAELETFIRLYEEPFSSQRVIELRIDKLTKKMESLGLK